MMPRVARPLGALAVGLLIVFPFLGPPIYFIHLLAGLYMNVALASSWALLGGYTGYLSLGQVTFFGIGAYTAAIGLSTYGISPFLTAPLGGIFAVLLAFQHHADGRRVWNTIALDAAADLADGRRLLPGLHDLGRRRGVVGAKNGA